MPRRARSTTGGISEAAFQGQVEALARFYGWSVYHPPDNRPVDGRGRRQRVTRGYPDLTCARDDVSVGVPELLIAELKRDTTYPDADQRAWLELLGRVAAASGGIVDVYLWRPRDWPAIEARLARGRRIVPASFDPRAA